MQSSHAAKKKRTLEDEATHDVEAIEIGRVCARE
jgi:hypothetical protein